MDTVNNNPAVIGGLIGTVLSSGVALIAIFVPGLTPEAQGAIIVFGNSVIALLVALYVIARSTPISAPKLEAGTEVTVITPEDTANRRVVLTENSGQAIPVPAGG